MRSQEWIRFMIFLSSFNIRVVSLYGLSECGLVLGCQLSDSDYAVVPLGETFIGIRCLLVNEQDQIITNIDNSGEVGQIHIGG